MVVVVVTVSVRTLVLVPEIAVWVAPFVVPMVRTTMAAAVTAIVFRWLRWMVPAIIVINRPRGARRWLIITVAVRVKGDRNARMRIISSSRLCRDGTLKWERRVVRFWNMSLWD